MLTFQGLGQEAPSMTPEEAIALLKEVISILEGHAPEEQVRFDPFDFSGILLPEVVERAKDAVRVIGADLGIRPLVAISGTIGDALPEMRAFVSAAEAEAARRKPKIAKTPGLAFASGLFIIAAGLGAVMYWQSTKEDQA